FARPVAQALANGAKEKGMLADAKVAASVEKTEGVIFLAVARPFTLMASLTMVGGGSAEFRKDEPQRRPRGAPPPPGGPAPALAPAPAAQPPRVTRVPRGAEDERVRKEVARLLEGEGLLVLRVTRHPDRVLAEATLTDLQRVVPRLADFALMRFAASHSKAPAPRPFEGRGESQKALPRPAPPEKP